MNQANISSQEKGITVQRSQTKYYVLLSSMFLMFHLYLGYQQVPQQFIDTGVSKGFKTIEIKVGYAMTILLYYAVPLPTLLILLSLLNKQRRYLLSVSKLFFWSLVVTLLINVFIGFILVPRFIQKIDLSNL